MTHNYDDQRAETFETFAEIGQDADLPKSAVVDYQFYPEEIDAQWDALAAALTAAGFTTTRYEDDETIEASIGPIEISAENVWKYEKIATEIALKFDFTPDGWGLVEA